MLGAKSLFTLAGLLGLTSASAAAAAAADARCKLSQQNPQLLNLDCQSDHIRFIGMGDWGETYEHGGVIAVRDGVLADAKTGSIDFILALGDNFYDKGVQTIDDKLWTTTWYDRFRIGTELTLPWISLLGNHDHYGNADAEVEFSKATKPGSEYWIMPEKFYSVDAKGTTGKKIKLMLTDTMIIDPASHFDWINKEVDDPDAAYVLALGHHHIYSAGGRGDNKKDAKMQAFRELLESKSQVKAYFCGHEHDMQYLRSAQTDYFMMGGSGRTMDNDPAKGTSAEVVYYQKNYGYAVFDLDLATSVMTVTYNVFNKDGKKIDQQVWQRNYAAAVAPPPAPSATTGAPKAVPSNSTVAPKPVPSNSTVAPKPAPKPTPSANQTTLTPTATPTVVFPSPSPAASKPSASKPSPSIPAQQSSPKPSSDKPAADKPSNPAQQQTTQGATPAPTRLAC
ncbi:TPA: hypothetical protein N0F65_008294 [Lagenidium giganteum]|uniref:Calcineurin-like phosphoesterase domain-containing protein n=1 Tax=Lagenidium giganteum TaxID=4803 RepID=A0AAV2YEU0_9STRA|nr:TPA: hypothetical protein N0F65_008294 [Lagenidium giganteum]